MRGVVRLDLIVEPTGHGGGVIHGGIVLLCEDFVELGLLRILLVLRQARIDLPDLLIMLVLQAVGLLLDEVVVGAH